MNKTITVKGIEQVAAGITNGNAWTIYRVTDQEGTEYKAFKPLNLGAPYQISYREEPRKPFVAKKGPEAGKMITPKGVDRFIQEFSISEAPPVGPGTEVPTETEFEELKRRVKKLEDAQFGQADF